MRIIKASGKKEEFNPEKISRTLIRAGADKKLASEIVSQIESKVKDGTMTREILDSSLKLLREKNPVIEARYDLKRAVMNLGPTGFPFEKYFAEILKHYGYETQVGQVLKGAITTHEIDIVAKKDSKRYMVELKYHNSQGIYTKLKVALYIYARFLDLKKQFDQAWIATNTRMSKQSVIYAKGMNMKITSWEYPPGESLMELIEKKKLYPITILKSVDNKIKQQLSNSDLVLATNLLKTDINELKKKTRIPENILRQIIDEARKILQ
jgi:Holliday junction resolvase/FtsZ-binding cell division protein ZapB